MKYSIYKLDFLTGVHFGNGMLNDSEYTFKADTLFSALYIEALKAGVANTLFQAVSSGQLLFSDAFPYVGSQYMIPKPVLYIEHGRKGNSNEKKRFKKMKYLPVGQLDAYLRGTMDPNEDPMKNFGKFFQKTAASVRNEKETLPYQVGTYYYGQGNGLYLILGYCEEEQKSLAEDLLTAIAYDGIGGKRSSGLGKFALRKGTNDTILLEYLNNSGTHSMLLSSALPKEDEMQSALEGATYLLEKRSGFIASCTYAEEYRKKKDLYVFSSGSCFANRFSGGIYDVSEGGNHPVYRYAMPLFMGV